MLEKHDDREVWEEEGEGGSVPSRKKVQKIESTIKVGGKEGCVCKHCWKKHDDREVWEEEGEGRSVSNGGAGSQFGSRSAREQIARMRRKRS